MEHRPPGTDPPRWGHHVLLGSLSLFLFAQAPVPPLAGADREPEGRVEKSIRTQKLELVGQDGKTGVVLGTLKDGTPALDFMDSQGRRRLTFGLSTRGEPHAYLHGTDPRSQISLFMSDTVGPSVNLHDAKGKMRLSVALSPDGSPMIQMVDADGKVSLDVSSSREFGSGVNIRGKGQKSAVHLGFSDADAPELMLENEVTDGRIYLTVPKTGPGATIIGAKSKIRTSWGLMPDGRPQFMLCDEQSRPVFSITLDDRGEPAIFGLKKQPEQGPGRALGTASSLTPVPPPPSNE